MTKAEQTTPERPPRRGPARRALNLLACVCEGGLLLILLAWLLGRVVSDRFLWTQYLGWMPTEPVVIAVLLLLLVAALLRWGRPRVLPVVAAVLALGWMLAAEWRVHRAVLPGPARGPVRVAFMNISHRGGDASLDPLFNAGTDIVIMSNVHPQPISFERIYGVTHQSLMERTIGRTPGEAPPGEAHMARVGFFHVYSEHPIRRRAAAFLGEQESWIEGDTRGGGTVVLLEIDTPGGPLVVWAVDMPSTLGASRRAMFEQMRAKVDGVTRVLTIDAVGRWVASELDARDPIRAPDLVVGDFNTPAYAWSVERFASGTRDARADAGWGPRGTFPAAGPFPGGIPLFPIDAGRLGDRVRATHASRLRCDGCRHMGLVYDLGFTRP